MWITIKRATTESQIGQKIITQNATPGPQNVKNFWRRPPIPPRGLALIPYLIRLGTACGDGGSASIFGPCHCNNYPGYFNLTLTKTLIDVSTSDPDQDWSHKDWLSSVIKVLMLVNMPLRNHISRLVHLLNLESWILGVSWICGLTFHGLVHHTGL